MLSAMPVDGSAATAEDLCMCTAGWGWDFDWGGGLWRVQTKVDGGLSGGCVVVGWTWTPSLRLRAKGSSSSTATSSASASRPSRVRVPEDHFAVLRPRPLAAVLRSRPPPPLGSSFFPSVFDARCSLIVYLYILFLLPQLLWLLSQP